MKQISLAGADMSEIETQTIDRLFLELSQFTKATTGRELALLAALESIVSEPHIDETTEMKLRLMAKEAIKKAKGAK